MEAPSVSLVIPVYNRPALITDCLRSLAPSLNELVEVIVVDDGSTDGKTPQAVEAAILAAGAPAKIRLVQQKNAGPGAARNTGAAAARGEWIAFLDSDDLWLPWSGRALREAIQRNPQAVVIFGNARPFARIGEVADWIEEAVSEKRHDDFFAVTRIKPRVIRIGSGYFAIRRETFAASTGFVPGLRGSEDTDLFYRIASAGGYVSLEYPALVARRTGGDDSLTLNMSALSEGLFYLMDGRRDGRYGPIRPEMDAALADLLAFWIHALFRGGWGREGYDLLLRQGGFGIMMRNGQRRAALKLIAVPLLSLIRPRNYSFSWRPRVS
ncbi:glycosyltransferase family A protein [Frigidibacter sp. MR17.14]|uniref:glycosyltransferase family 2 protein n=1 Tax=Frigidibacter sp. MR17.14 TaxID=3126509 RepID=UPI003012DBAF